jgi:hypothetical protein
MTTMLLAVYNFDNASLAGQQNNTYRNFYSIIAFFPPSLGLPGCTVVDDAKVNEGFIGDGE